jgi:hypothetical protein
VPRDLLRLVPVSLSSVSVRGVLTIVLWLSLLVEGEGKRSSVSASASAMDTSSDDGDGIRSRLVASSRLPSRCTGPDLLRAKNDIEKLKKGREFDALSSSEQVMLIELQKEKNLLMGEFWFLARVLFPDDP